MTDEVGGEVVVHRRRRRVSKRGNRKRRKLIQNVRWIVGGLAIGLPAVLLLIYLASAVLAYYR